jgi:hypothetical protein
MKVSAFFNSQPQARMYLQKYQRQVSPNFTFYYFFSHVIHKYLLALILKNVEAMSNQRKISLERLLRCALSFQQEERSTSKGSISF